MDKYVFPQELQMLRQWVCWRLEPDKKSGRDAKAPYSPGTGYKASASDKSTWGTLDQALEARGKYLFSGIGFVFTAESDIIGIDIDHCLVDGQPNEVGGDIGKAAPNLYRN